MLTQRILVTLEEQGALPFIPISCLPFNWTHQTGADGAWRAWAPRVCVLGWGGGGLYLLFMYF